MGTLHQVKITLKGVKPAVWRRLLVPSDFTLAQAHGVLLTGMGWAGYHMCESRIGHARYLDPEDDGPDDSIDPRSVRLVDVVEPGDWFLFNYDFGDGWKHQIVVEDVVPSAGRTRPVCLTGQRACPPEDVGGPLGYGDFLDAITNSEHQRHDELIEWIGGSFDPDAFDAGEIDQTFATLADLSD